LGSQDDRVTLGDLLIDQLDGPFHGKNEYGPWTR
jgi:hypothetical protein